MMRIPAVVSVIVCAATLVHVASPSAVGCTKPNLTTRPCLDVFTHVPANLPKCYCTNFCEQELVTVYRIYITVFFGN